MVKPEIDFTNTQAKPVLIGSSQDFASSVKTGKAECNIVGHTHHWKRTRSGKKVKVPTYSVAIPLIYDQSKFTPGYFDRNDVNTNKIFQTRHKHNKKFCAGRQGSPFFCHM